MENQNYTEVLADNICYYRKKLKITQEELANKLDISFQAVSKWENKLSSPDISLLPTLANIFEVSIDKLFNISTENILNTTIPNDDNIRICCFKGQQLLQTCSDLDNVVINLEGNLNNVISYVSIECTEILGDAKAGCDINCTSIANNATAGCDLTIHGNIGNNAKAGCDLCVTGNVNKDAKAGVSVTINGILKGKN